MAYKNTKRKQKSTELIKEANTKTKKHTKGIEHTKFIKQISIQSLENTQISKNKCYQFNLILLFNKKLNETTV